jgi:hypothetical protein
MFIHMFRVIESTVKFGQCSLSEVHSNTVWSLLQSWWISVRWDYDEPGWIKLEHRRSLLNNDSIVDLCCSLEEKNWEQSFSSLSIHAWVLRPARNLIVNWQREASGGIMQINTCVSASACNKLDCQLATWGIVWNSAWNHRRSLLNDDNIVDVCYSLEEFSLRWILSSKVDRVVCDSRVMSHSIAQKNITIIK